MGNKTKILLLSFIMVIISSLLTAQTSVNVGTDIKTLTIGSDNQLPNQWTKHDGVLNFHIRLEHIDDEQTYWALGYEYVNLREKFNALYINAGLPREIFKDKYKFKVLVIPILELGGIDRELPEWIPQEITNPYTGETFMSSDNRRNPVSVYLGLALELRLDFGWYSLASRLGVEHATDIEGRAFRWGTDIAFIINLDEL